MFLFDAPVYQNARLSKVTLAIDTNLYPYLPFIQNDCGYTRRVG